MGYYSGTDGELQLYDAKAGTHQTLARVRNWSFSSSVATLDTTNLGDTDRTVVSGIRSTTGACSLFYYQDAPGGGGDASLLIRKLVQARTTQGDDGVAPKPQNARMKLRIKDGSVLGRYIEGDCVLTSVSMTMAVGEVLSADVAFEFNGAPLGVVL